MGNKRDDRMDCGYCGKKNEEQRFFIGAKRKEHEGFVMVEGTGKMACNDCYPEARKEGAAAVERHVREVNRKAKEASK